MSDAESPPPELRQAVEAFHAALDAGPSWMRSSHGREGDWVDAPAEAVVDALLAAGWTPPRA